LISTFLSDFSVCKIKCSDQKVNFLKSLNSLNDNKKSDALGTSIMIFPFFDNLDLKALNVWIWKGICSRTWNTVIILNFSFKLFKLFVIKIFLLIFFIKFIQSSLSSTPANNFAFLIIFKKFPHPHPKSSTFLFGTYCSIVLPL
jgi:hypothetical protein